MASQLTVNFKGIKPNYMTKGSAGADLVANIAEPYLLQVGQTKAFPTGVSIECPEGYVADVRSRSGLSLKNITVHNSPGTIDSDYRGEIAVILHNSGSQAFEITPQMRIAQLLFFKVEQVAFVSVDDLSDTLRGSSGFGSTG